MDDWQLLQDYAINGSEAAFHTLVERYLGLVQSSALRQVEDAQLAEEISQSVFILLARKAGSLSRDVVLAGWLFQTTRFVAARARRAELRRRQREQEAYDMEDRTNPEQTWKRIAPILDEGLAKLRDTDRNAVLLRFVQGRNHQEVGLALGLSEEAARKRVDRALEKLRSFFTRHGVVLSAAVLGSLMLANTAKAASSGLTGAIGAAAVKYGALKGAALPGLAGQALDAWRWAKIKLTAGFATAVLVVAALLWVPMSHRAAPITPAPAAPETPAVTTAKTDAVVRPITTPVNTGNSGTNILHFHVVARDTGEPVANAKLAVNKVTKASWHTEYGLATDASGECDIPWTPDVGRLDVGVLSNGWGARFCTWRQDQHPIPAEYTLSVERLTNSMSGTVKDGSGNPLAGIPISISFGGTGDASWSETAVERPGFIDESTAAITDENGHWSCSLVPSDNRGFTLEVKEPGFQPTRIAESSRYQSGRESGPDLDTVQQLSSGTLVTILKRGVTLIGRVTDAAGEPVANASLDHDPTSTEPVKTKTDSDGRFAISNLTEGPFEFTVSASGFASEFHSANVKEGMDPLTIPLQPGATLLVQVVDEETSEPVPKVRVGLQAIGDHNNALDWSAKSDAHGRVEWDSAPVSEELTLYAVKSDWCYTRYIRITADGQVHPIHLRKALKVTGDVIDAKTGAPIPAFSAFPGYGEGSGESVWYRGETRHGTNGAFTLTLDENRLPWCVQVQADGYAPLIIDVLPTGSSTNLVFALQPADPSRAVHGWVLNPDGSPAAGAQLAILTLDYNASLVNATFRDERTGILTNTDAAGQFSFSANPRAHSVAAVSSNGFAHVRVANPAEPITLQLQPFGRVEGTVADKERAQPIQYMVLMDDAAMNYKGSVRLDINYFNAKVDATGHFSFENVPPGNFGLYISRGMGIPFCCRTTVAVRPGETTTAQIGGQGITVIGRLSAHSGAVFDWSKQTSFMQLSADDWQTPPRPKNLTGDQAELWAMDFWQSAAGMDYIQKSSAGSFGVTVAADGSFRAEEVAPGTYKLKDWVSGKFHAQEVIVPDAQASGGQVDLGTIEFPDL